MKNEGKISEEVCLLFDKIYLQKCEEYFGGDFIGCGEDGNLHKGLVCFMIIGLKESAPYVIKSSPQTGISADWLENEVLECLDVLIKCGFTTRAIICDNRPSNVSAFKKLLQCSNQDPDSLFILKESRKFIFPLKQFILLKTFEIIYLIIKIFCFHPLHSMDLKTP